jgi:hypothetical protein
MIPFKPILTPQLIEGQKETALCLRDLMCRWFLPHSSNDRAISTRIERSYCHHADS